ncbi:hypothetical protein T265_14791, partial [Opisthorchis viverrini]
KLLIRLLKTLRQPTTNSALLEAHQLGSVPEVSSTLFSTLTQIALFSRNTLICKSFWFSRETQVNLIYDILQLNELHTDCLMFQKLLTSLLKTLRQPPTGFALLGTHQKYTHLQINLVFTGDSTESLLHDILQLNVLQTGRLMSQLARFLRYRKHSNLGSNRT